MKPVFQTKLPPYYTTGNCLAACLATILDLRIDEVPNVEVLEQAPNNLWQKVLIEWLLLHHLKLEGNEGLLAMHRQELTSAKRAVLLEAFRDCPYIAQGMVGGVYHAAVYANGRLVHDPTPTGAGLDTFEEVFLLRRLTASGQPDLLLHDKHLTYSTVPQEPDY